MTVKYFLRTFGCRVNQCETDELRAQLAAKGCLPAVSLAEADLCLVNTCAVTRDADREALKFLRRVTRENPQARLVVTGCLVERAASSVRQIAPRASLIENDRKKALCEILELPHLKPQPVERDRARAFLKIQDGCDGSCSYCVVPLVRPRLKCLAAETAERKVEGFVAEGVCEIVLCGIRLGRYRDGATDLVGLLKRLILLPGTFRLRLSSLEIGEASDDLALLIASSKGKICPHLHLPLQSGSDVVLRRMNRPYTASDFANRVEALHRRIPSLAIFTDIIVGFPAETDSEFQEGLDFARGLGLRGLHVFSYSLRDGTRAASMPDQIPPRVIHERLKAWRELDHSLRQTHAQEAMGQEREIVLLKTGSKALTEDFLTVRLEGVSAPGLQRIRLQAANLACRDEKIPV